MSYSDERLRKIYDCYRENGEEAANELGLKPDSLHRRLREYRQRFKDRQGQDKYDFEKKENENEIELTLESHEVRTIDELLAYSKIDTNIWEVYKSVTNTWGSPANPNHQIKIWLRRKNEDLDIKKACDYIVDRIQKYSPPNIIKRKDKGEFLYEVGLTDLHLGQLSWGKEVGSDYDVDIAIKVAEEAIDFLCDKVTPYKVGKVLYIIGNDYLNVASLKNTTTGGTFQDEDGRYHRSFTCGVDVHVDAINKLKKIADVHALVIPGNHSTEREFYLSAVLQAWFRNDKNVFIDNSPVSRKYYRYGSNLLGFAHGDKDLKIDRLLGLMPIEAKEDWARATNYEWHLGHLHHDAKMQHNLKSENGIKIRRLNTLVPLDAWHYGQGYLRIRETQAFLWHESMGDMVHINYRIK